MWWLLLVDTWRRKDGDYGYRGSELCFPMTGDWTSSVAVPPWQLKTTSLGIYCGFSVILIFQHPLSTSPTSHTSRYNQNFARLSWLAAGRSFQSFGTSTYRPSYLYFTPTPNPAVIGQVVLREAGRGEISCRQLSSLFQPSAPFSSHHPPHGGRTPDSVTGKKVGLCPNMPNSKFSSS